MKKPLLLFFFTFLITAALVPLVPLTALSNDSSSYKQFHLIGKVVGLKKGNIYLRYTTEDSGTVWDSCALQNGSFHFYGKVNEPTIAEISLDREMSFGPDRAEVFLEEGNLNIKAIKGSFSSLQMSGSLSQKEYENLSLAKRKVLLELFDVQKKLISTNTAAVEKESLEKRALILYKEKAKADSLFIIQNPSSFVTAYLIKMNMDFEQFSLGPIDNLYDQMPVAVKESSYGKKILWHINKVQKAPLGHLAPYFSAKTINGNIISLKQFQDKSFVLLDFWGSWCFPCRRLTPNLKEIYEIFHDKGFEIISIAINDKEENWKKAIAEDSTQRWQHILDNNTIKNLYAADYVPAFYLISREGKIIARYNGGERAYGEKPYWELYQDLKELLGKTN